MNENEKVGQEALGVAHGRRSACVNVHIVVGLFVLNYSPEAGVPYAANSTNPVLPPLLSTTSKRRTPVTKFTAKDYGWVASGSSKGPYLWP